MKKMSYGPTASHIILCTLAAQLLYCGSVYASNGTGNCKLIAESKSERGVLSRLEPLLNKNFTVETTISSENYMYVFQLCGDAGGVPGAGLIQIDTKDKKPTVIGLYTSTQAFGGRDWVMLIYNNGETYDGHCSKEARRGIVMISCNSNMEAGPLNVILEDRERPKDCFYLFEIDSSAVCLAEESHLSAGSIILIIGLCLLAVYLIGGFLYQRLIVGAKGMEQFPNHAFWVEIGNLTADGCDFVCRSGNREGSPAYSGVATGPSEEEPEERDDHLLPM